MLDLFIQLNVGRIIDYRSTNPEDTLEYDKDGNPSYTYIGERVVVIRNPDNGVIITTRRPNRYERNKWIKKDRLYY